MKKSLAVFVVWPAVFIFAILSFATTKPVHAANLGETCNVNIGSAGVGASQRSGICRAITSTSGCQPGEENIAMGNCAPTAMVNGANVALRCCGPPVAPTTCVGAGGVCWPSGTCSSPVPGNPSCYPSSTEVCCQRGAIGATPSTNDSFTVTGRDLLNYQLLEQIPGSDETVGRLDTYLQDIYRFAFWTVGIAVVFMLTIGGFMYLTAAGNTSRMESAKTVIFDAILGLVLALVAWLFLYVINPDLVNLNLRAISITPIASRTAPTAPAPTPSTPGVPPPSGTVQDLAQQIRAGGNGINLAGSGSCSSTAGTVSPSLTMQQAASGIPVIRCQHGCPSTGQCTQTTNLSSTLLSAMLQVARQYPYTVTSITGGSHCEAGVSGCRGTSAHYAGRAIDISTSNKADWPAIVTAFRNAGASGQTACDYNGTLLPSSRCNEANHIHVAF